MRYAKRKTVAAVSPPHFLDDLSALALWGCSSRQTSKKSLLSALLHQVFQILVVLFVILLGKSCVHLALRTQVCSKG
jgi:hypothetical protein